MMQQKDIDERRRRQRRRQRRTTAAVVALFAVFVSVAPTVEGIKGLRRNGRSAAATTGRRRRNLVSVVTDQFPKGDDDDRARAVVGDGDGPTKKGVSSSDDSDVAATTDPASTSTSNLPSYSDYPDGTPPSALPKKGSRPWSGGESVPTTTTTRSGSLGNNKDIKKGVTPFAYDRDFRFSCLVSLTRYASDGMLSQIEYANFVFDYCRYSRYRGPSCDVDVLVSDGTGKRSDSLPAGKRGPSASRRASAFPSLPVDVQLAFASSACPVKDRYRKLVCVEDLILNQKEFGYTEELEELCEQTSTLLETTGLLQEDEEEEEQDEDLPAAEPTYEPDPLSEKVTEALSSNDDGKEKSSEIGSVVVATATETALKHVSALQENRVVDSLPQDPWEMSTSSGSQEEDDGGTNGNNNVLLPVVLTACAAVFLIVLLVAYLKRKQLRDKRRARRNIRQKYNNKGMQVGKPSGGGGVGANNANTDPALLNGDASILSETSRSFEYDTGGDSSGTPVPIVPACSKGTVNWMVSSAIVPAGELLRGHNRNQKRSVYDSDGRDDAHHSSDDDIYNESSSSGDDSSIKRLGDAAVVSALPLTLAPARIEVGPEFIVDTAEMRATSSADEKSSSLSSGSVGPSTASRSSDRTGSDQNDDDCAASMRRRGHESPPVSGSIDVGHESVSSPRRQWQKFKDRQPFYSVFGAKLDYKSNEGTGDTGIRSSDDAPVPSNINQKEGSERLQSQPFAEDRSVSPFDCESPPSPIQSDDAVEFGSDDESTSNDIGAPDLEGDLKLSPTAASATNDKNDNEGDSYNQNRAHWRASLDDF